MKKVIHTILIGVVIGVLSIQGYVTLARRWYTPKKVWVTTTGYLNLGNIVSVYGLSPLDTLALTAGTATGMFIGSADAGGEVAILGSDSGTYINGTIEINGCNNLSFYKIKAHDVSGRWFFLENSRDNMKIANCRIDRSNDYQVYLHSGTAYDGTGTYRFDEVTLVNDTFRGCGNANTISTGGAVTKSLYIGYCVFDSTYGANSTGISITDIAFDPIIEYCTFTHINKGGTAHNAVIYACVSHGKIRYCYCHDRQGDFCRLRAYWGDSSALGSLPDTSDLYGNRDDGADKYAFCEVQHRIGSGGGAQDTTTNTDLPNIRTGVFRIMNNTSLHLRDGGYVGWNNSSGGGGSMFDVYDWRRKVIIMNNYAGWLYMDSIPDPDHPPGAYTFNPMYHDGGGSKPVGQPVFGDTVNNVYIVRVSNMGFADSLQMTIKSSSPARARGTSAYSYVFQTDYLGARFGNSWPVGAHQYRVDHLKRRRKTVFK